MSRKSFGAGIILCALASTAVAQSVPPPDAEAAHRQARQDLAEGQRLLSGGEPAAALGRFEASYAAEPTGAALLGLAESQRRTDRIPEAHRSYERLLAARATELGPDERAGAERALADLTAATGSVLLSGVDPQAAYTVDDRPLAADLVGGPIHLSPGRHVLGATRAGFAPVAFPIWTTAGKQLTTSLTLRPEPGTVAPAAPGLPSPWSAPAAAPPPPPPAAPPPPAPVATLPPPAAPAPAPPPLPTPPPVAPLAPPPPSSADAPPFPESMSAPPPPPAQPTDPFAEGTHVGLILGVLSFPRPLEGEVVVKLESSLAVSLKGSMLPQLSVPGVDAKLDLEAIEGIVRWFPFHGVFFLGGGFGYQSFKASIGQTVDNQELTTTADMSSFFVSPQLGVLWVSSSGFSLSLGLGLQIPLPKDPVVTSTYAGQPVPAQPTSTVPQDVIDQAQSSQNSVHSVASLIVKYPFPTLDLLRIGIFF